MQGKFFLYLLVMLCLTNSLYGKIRHPISIPEFDDNDTIEFISLDFSVANFFNNKQTLSARPNGSGVAFNRYNFDLNFERNNFFAEIDLALLTDKTLEPAYSRLSEHDWDIIIGTHAGDTWNIYLERESYAPFDRTMKMSFQGVGITKGATGYFIGHQYNLFIDFEKILSSQNFSPRYDGQGKVNMVYTLHADYDLPDKFSFSCEHVFYTLQDQKSLTTSYVRTSEWDQVYQLNYQMNSEVIVSLFHEIDHYHDQFTKNFSYSGVQLLYEF